MFYRTFDYTGPQTEGPIPTIALVHGYPSSSFDYHKVRVQPIWDTEHRETDSPLNPGQDWNLGADSIWNCSNVWSYWIWIFWQANERFHLFNFWIGWLLTHAFQRIAIKWYYSYRSGFTIVVMTSSETYSLMVDPYKNRL